MGCYREVNRAGVFVLQSCSQIQRYSYAWTMDLRCTGIQFRRHWPYTKLFTPVDYTINENADGSVSCTVGAIDLPSRTKWNVEILENQSVVQPYDIVFIDRGFEMVSDLTDFLAE